MLLFKLYSWPLPLLRKMILWLINKTEKEEMYSQTLRRILKEYYGVEIGLYSYGSCFKVGQFDPETKIGRYCSIAANVAVFNRNHPIHFKSTHPFFFNSRLKHITAEEVPYIPLIIGNDVWIGYGAIILPCVTEIGDGAVIGAGAVVTKNVPPYSIVMGVPATIKKYRFSRERIQELLNSKWWEKGIEQIHPEISQYQKKINFET